MLVVDGLGWEQLPAPPALAPTLAAMDGWTDHDGRADDDGNGADLDRDRADPGRARPDRLPDAARATCLNVLRWARAERRPPGDPPRDVQPFAPFLGRAGARWSRRPSSGARRSPRPHLRGHVRSATGPSAIAVEVGRQLRAGERFVYAYYDGVDKTGHDRGFGAFYDAELRAADRLVAAVLDEMPPGAVLSSPPTTARSTSATASSSPTATSSPWSPSSRARGASAGCTPAGRRRRPAQGGHRAVRGCRLGRQQGPGRRRALVRPDPPAADGRPPRRRRPRHPRPGQLPRPGRHRTVPARLSPRFVDLGGDVRPPDRLTPRQPQRIMN